MGNLTCTTLREQADLQLVGELERKDLLAERLAELRPDVVVDFTEPGCVFKNSLIIVEAGIRLVIGTSGLLAEEVEELARRCLERQIGGVIAPNFALGAVLMMRFADEAARHLETAEIIEAHHPRKLDVPSGTALSTAGRIARRTGGISLGGVPRSPARGMDIQGIPVHSIRLSGLVAEQEVLFGGTGETLSIVHRIYGREAFMPGVLLACRRVMALQRLVVGLDEILFPTSIGETRILVGRREDAVP